MAVNRRTLRLLRQLHITVGTQADQATRALTRSWVRAWDELSAAWRLGIADAVAQTAATGQWPQPWQLARIERLMTALQASEDALARLGERTGVVVTDGAGRVIQATAHAEPRLIASQLPAAMQAEAAAAYAARILPSALDIIVARTSGQITATTRPLSAQATEMLRRELIRGIAVGDNPRTVAAQLLARVEGQFNGGLTRALNVARTEMLDAYRTTSRYAHAANRDVLAGWVWHSSLDRRTCPSCWAMHGTVHPLEEPGPLDHQQGRCTRLPKTKTWRELGIDLDEPADLTANAEQRWRALSPADQDAAFGPARAELVRTGQVAWADLARLRDTPGWRSSYAATPVRDLPRQPVAA